MACSRKSHPHRKTVKCSQSVGLLLYFYPGCKASSFALGETLRARWLLLDHFRKGLLSWVTPLLLVLISLLLQIWLRPVLGDRRYILLYPALLLGAFLGNQKATLLAAVVGAIGVGLYLPGSVAPVCTSGSCTLIGPFVFLLSAVLAAFLSQKVAAALLAFREVAIAQIDLGRMSEHTLRQAEIFDTALSLSPRLSLHHRPRPAFHLRE